MKPGGPLGRKGGVVLAPLSSLAGAPAAAWALAGSFGVHGALVLVALAAHGAAAAPAPAVEERVVDVDVVRRGLHA